MPQHGRGEGEHDEPCEGVGTEAQARGPPGPWSKKAAKLFEAEGPTSAGAMALMSCLFLVILALMAFKPVLRRPSSPLLRR
jgi:hypothetical protein